MHSLERIAWVRKLATNGGARAIREAAGISAAELARSLEVTPSTVSLWERGLRLPREAIALRYADALEQLSISRYRRVARESGFVHISEPLADELRRLAAEGES